MSAAIGRPAICNETASDESFLLGTKQQLVEFARTILQILDSPTRSAKWHGIPVEHAVPGPALTEPMCETVLDGLIIVKSENDRRVLINHILANCGDPQIAWDERSEPST